MITCASLRREKRFHTNCAKMETGLRTVLLVLCVITAVTAQTKKIYSECTEKAQCPVNAGCKPNGCDGVNCLCDFGYIANFDYTGCVPAAKIGEACGQGTSCTSVLAFCSPGGECDCLSFFRRSNLNSCTYAGKKVIGENCTSDSDCADPMATCSATTTLCECRTGYRTRDEYEFWANPLLINECVEDSFNLFMCKSEEVTPVVSSSTESPSDSPMTTSAIEPITSQLV